MAKVVVEYNLDNPEDRAVYDSTTNSWRYKRLIGKLINELTENSLQTESRKMLSNIRTAAQEIGLTEIRDHADNALRTLSVHDG